MYQAGFSSTLRRITPGVCVPLYPNPIMGTVTVLRAASARSSASACVSVAAGGRSRAAVARIASGTAASARSSREPCPTTASILACSSSLGPM